jgi:endonuclease/exonuclease/phosphatase family metal-dependent hydrolase
MKPFRVLQFNIQFGQSWREVDPDHAPVDLDATIREILAQDADIVMLQEVEHAQPGGTQSEPPVNYSRIAAALRGYHGAFGYPKADIRELPFGIGLAIFSRSPVVAISREDIPSPPITFNFFGKSLTPTDRVMIGARTQVGGREVQLFNTHLLAFFMLKTSTEEHPEQVKQVTERVRNSPLPTIVTGDFNVNRHQFLVDAFSGAGFTSAQTSESTWRRKPYVLDHIFYNAPIRCVRRAVLPTPASDHHMLVADFEFEG